MRIAVLGLGLIGGSIGLAARREGIEVAGYDPDPDVLATALERGAIDRGAASVAGALGEADVAFACAPVGALAELVEAVLDAAGEECAVSDVGSTKRSLLAALGARAGDRRLIGGHPMAGAERGGIAAARAELFDGAAWCLMPPAPGAEHAAARLRALIETLGAHVVEIEAEAHDRLMAEISQMPHILANLLVLAAGRQAGGCAGPSFRDATRVAGADTAVWRDIYLANADVLADAIDRTIAGLGEVRAMLASGDGEALAAWNERARTRRERELG